VEKIKRKQIPHSLQRHETAASPNFVYINLQNEVKRKLRFRPLVRFIMFIQVTGIEPAQKVQLFILKLSVKSVPKLFTNLQKAYHSSPFLFEGFLLLYMEWKLKSTVFFK